MNEDPEIAEFEEAGFELVRQRLTFGEYSHERKGRAERWMAQQAEKRRNATLVESLDVAKATQEATWMAAEAAKQSAAAAKAANEIAVHANELARQANERASVANAIARRSSAWARVSGIAALIACVVTVLALVLRG